MLEAISEFVRRNQVDMPDRFAREDIESAKRVFYDPLAKADDGIKCRDKEFAKFAEIVCGEKGLSMEDGDFVMVPEARIELARSQGPLDFESSASTNFTTPAR